MNVTPSDDNAGRYRIGDLVLDAGTLRVERGGQALKLPLLSYRMLECLARHAPNAVSFDRLVEEVWQGVVVNQETMIQRVRLLREALGDDSRDPKIIESVRGYGYRLIPEVTSIDAEPPGRPKRRPLVGIGLVAAALVAAVAAATALFALLPDRHSRDTATVSVAVLPFTNLSSDPEQAYLAEGLSIELSSLLARVPGLRVVAFTSAAAAADSGSRIDEIADELGVEHVLEGSVRRSGNEIRVTAQLITARDGFNLWSETYERRMTSIFEVQDDIADSIVNALRPELTGNGTSTRKTDPDAYAHYLKGRYLDNLKGEENWRAAVQAYERSLAIDPDYAPTWAALSLTYFYMSNRLLPLESGMEMARDAARRALSIDPREADAWATLSLIRNTYDWDHAGAVEAIERAIALAPSNSNVLNRAGSLALTLDKPQQAIAMFEASIALDPLSMSPRNSLALAQMSDGRYSEAEATLHELIALNPDYPWANINLGRTLLLQEKPAEAIRAASDKGPVFWQLSVLIMARHMLGDAQASEELVAEFRESFGERSPMVLAEIHAWRGEADQAFASLGQAVRIRDPAAVTMLQTPFLEPLYGDPRWMDIRRQVNLAELPELNVAATVTPD